MIATVCRISWTRSRTSSGMPSEVELVHTWMIHHIQIIGEAANKLSATFRKAHSQVPWSQIITMRHVLVHDYLGIDLGEIWAVVERDLPALKKQIRQMVRP